MFVKIPPLYFKDGRPLGDPFRNDFTLIKGETFALNSEHVFSLQEVVIAGETFSLLKTKTIPELLVNKSFDNLQKSLGLTPFEQLAPKTGKLALNHHNITTVFRSEKSVTGINMLDDSAFLVKGNWLEFLKKLNA